MDVRDLMTHTVFVLGPHMPLSEAAQALRAHDVGGAPVCDPSGRLLGVLSVSDLIDAAYGESANRGLVVADVMCNDVIAVAVTEPASSAVKLMAFEGIHRVIVRDGDDVVGIVTPMDIVRALAEGKTVFAPH
jgi:CBS domain-containing protein